MRAMVIDQFGEPDVFHPADLPVPEVPPGHLLIRVAASSVNPVDTKIRNGRLQAIAPPRPAILHGDVAGTVAAVGEGVTEFTEGDAVYACAGGVGRRQGALAEFMLAEAALVAKAPAGLSPLQAAALPLVAITAWEALIDKADVQAGETVLLFGGTGGVGHIGLQLCKWRGAKVVATASTPGKVDLARQLGADAVVDARTTDIEAIVAEHTGGRGFDLVFDTVGGDNLQKSFRAARYNGRVATTAARSTQDLSEVHGRGLTLHAVFMLIPMLHDLETERHGAILREVARLVEAGHLRPLVDEHRFGFSQVADAHRFLESGQAVGKVVLENDLG